MIIGFYFTVLILLAGVWLGLLFVSMMDYLDSVGTRVAKEDARKFLLCAFVGPFVVVLWPLALVVATGWLLYHAGRDAFR